MAKNDNLTDFLTDIADAIRQKKGTQNKINPQDFASEISSISSGGDSSSTRYTGHADAEGLRAIGWTDEDIAYYQENGVNWNEEDDEYHKVTDNNKALYGVLTAENIKTYKDRIVYLPKIDTSGITSMNSMFSNCFSLVSIPQLDTSSVKDMTNIFFGCYSLVSIPPLDTSSVTTMYQMFKNCYSIVFIPQLDTSSVKDMNGMFSGCNSLVSIPLLNTSIVTNMNSMFNTCNSLVSIPQLNTSNVTNMNSMFRSCSSLACIPQLDTSNVTNMNSTFFGCDSLVSIPQLNTSKVTTIYRMFSGCNSLVSIPLLDAQMISTEASIESAFTNCYNLSHAFIKNIVMSCDLSESSLLSKESLLYLINNEVATSAITITLAAYAYTRLAEDADVVEALTNHPNISIASA